MTSFVFNEVVELHVHNQQEYKLVVDHGFVDILSLHATVLWCYSLEQPRMRVTLWCILFLRTSGGCVMIPQ